jgi:hypothetical protein
MINIGNDQSFSPMGKTLIVSAIVVFILFIFNEVQFAWSLSKSVTATLSVIVISFVTIIFGILIPMAFQKEQPILGTFYLLGWLFLLAVEGFHQLGFMAIKLETENQQAALASLPAKIAEQRLEKAELEITQWNRYANIHQEFDYLKSQSRLLEAKLATLKTQLEACPNRWKKNCIDPIIAKIHIIRSELQPMEIKLQGYEQYQAALTAKEQALADWQQALNDFKTTGTTQTGFLWASRLFQVSVNTIFIFWSVFITGIIVIWPSAAIILALVYFSVPTAANNRYQVKILELASITTQEELLELIRHQLTIGKPLSNTSNEKTAVVKT